MGGLRTLGSGRAGRNETAVQNDAKEWEESRLLSLAYILRGDGCERGDKGEVGAQVKGNGSHLS